MKELLIPAEVWKIDDFHPLLMDFCNNVYNQDPINRRREGCLLPIPKKRQPRDHQELQRNKIDSNCSKDLQLDAPKQNKTQTRPSLEKKPKQVPHKPINLRTKTHNQMYLGRH